MCTNCCQYTLEIQGFKRSLLLIIFIASAFVFIPVWKLIAGRFGKRKAYLIANICALLAWSSMAIPTKGQFWFALAVTAATGATGIPLTYSNFLYQSIQGDCIDYDELRTGLRREAQFYNLMQYLNWFMSIGSISAPLWILSILGFKDSNTTQTQQSPTVDRAIGLLIGSAGAFALLAALFFLLYPIGKAKHRRVLEGIENHKQGLDAVDPVTEEIIPSHKLVPEAARNAFWNLFCFAVWELKLTNMKGVCPLAHAFFVSECLLMFE
jgi:GPH family glycoside/pentoside/hexuronide:cation symporter